MTKSKDSVPAPSDKPPDDSDTDRPLTSSLEGEEWWKVHRPRILQGSLNEFREAYLRRAKTGERRAYIEAIRALTGVLMYLEKPLNLSDDDPAVMWFVDLIRHLEDLDAGIVPPAFRCPVQSKGLSTAEWMERAWAVLAIELLHATGMKYLAAAKRAILHRQLHGVSEEELLSWRKEFRKGRVKNREAASVYEDYMAGIRECNAQELQDWIRREKLGE
jgi:hypothetical protein